MTAVEELLKAVEMVENVAGRLDLTECLCGQCNRTNYRNFAHARYHTELKAIVRKLQRFAETAVFQDMQ